MAARRSGSCSNSRRFRYSDSSPSVIAPRSSSPAKAWPLSSVPTAAASPISPTPSPGSSASSPPKSLRGVKMEDVIFAGTRDRKPTGMAEVSLTLVDPEVYEGVDGEPEIGYRRNSRDDWDEAASKPQARPKRRDRSPARPIDRRRRERSGAGSERCPANTKRPGRLPKSRRPKRRTPAICRRPEDPPPQVQRGPVRAGEITITRRLFRSGESEYLLNGKLCRLRDIQDIFMGTGLGPESYAIIEQGRIGQILSAPSRTIAARSSKKPPASPDSRPRNASPKSAWKPPSRTSLASTTSSKRSPGR